MMNAEFRTLILLTRETGDEDEARKNLIFSEKVGARRSPTSSASELCLGKAGMTRCHEQRPWIIESERSDRQSSS